VAPWSRQVGDFLLFVFPFDGSRGGEEMEEGTDGSRGGDGWRRELMHVDCPGNSGLSLGTDIRASMTLVVLFRFADIFTHLQF